MRIHNLLPPLPSPPPPPRPAPPSRTGVALEKLEGLQLLWRDGQRRRRAQPDSTPDDTPSDTGDAEAPETAPSPTRLNITA